MAIKLIQPGNNFLVESQFTKAVQLLNAGDSVGASNLLQANLKANPRHYESLYLHGLISAQNSQWHIAVEFFSKALQIKNNDASIYNNLGNVLFELKRLDESLASFNKAIDLKPDYAQAYFNLGMVLSEFKRWADALKAYEKAIEFNQAYAEAYFSRGVVLSELGRFEESLMSYEKAIGVRVDYAQAYLNKGLILQELNRLDEALENYDRAIELKSDFAEAYASQASIYRVLGRFEEALLCYDKAIEYRYDFPFFYFNRGLLLKDLNRPEEAIFDFEKAIKLKDDFAEAYFNCGNVHFELRDFDAAMFCYDKAKKFKHDYIEAFISRAHIFKFLRLLDGALVSYEQAIEFQCDFAQAYSSRADVMAELKRYDEAIKNYERALYLRFDLDFVLGDLLYTKMFVCNWGNFEIDIGLLISRITDNKKVSLCFQILSLIDSPFIQRKTSEIWMRENFPSNSSLGLIAKHSRKEKLRVGYFSADLREHAVSYLTAELFELHDKNLFEVYAFYYGPPDESLMQQRISSSVDHFFDVRYKTDKDIAIQSRELGIDIAVDLTGHTYDGRPGIFSYRSAPIQLSYIGYLGTMGAEYYDYLIADETIIPVESQKYYTEKILYLPSYQVNDSKREISDRVVTRAEFGLPASGFVFCCFNQSYKITPATYDVWMEILKATPESVLFLYANNAIAEKNLRSEAEKRGVSQSRLFFGANIERKEYLARYRVADLFLDTLPYNAGTTASDALWAGLPVLTCMGESFASRTAASLLRAIELPELIAFNYDEYKKLAIEMATDKLKIEEVKNKLMHNLKTTSLFDAAGFTRSLESAYMKIFDRYQSDLVPVHVQCEITGSV